MFAELLGKEVGYCKGKGGSMHIADPDTGNLGANAIVGGSTGIATGAAFSAKRLGTGQVAVCFFGDGALGQGLLYEVMNMASLWKLPVIYVCENNLYNEYTHMSETTAGNIELRGPAFGVPAETIDGQDVRAVYKTSRDLSSAPGQVKGPAFLFCNTYRFHGHHVGDVNREYYRSKQEEQIWKTERDPITLMGECDDGGRSGRSRPHSTRFTVKSRRRCKPAVQIRESTPLIPAPTRLTKTYMPEIATATRELTFGEAVSEALAEEMRRDPHVFICGEDIAEAGHRFKVLTGLVDEFGTDRVLDTPISEAGFTGMAVGAAMTGMRPVVDIMFGDFIDA